MYASLALQIGQVPQYPLGLVRKSACGRRPPASRTDGQPSGDRLESFLSIDKILDPSLDCAVRTRAEFEELMANESGDLDQSSVGKVCFHGQSPC